MKYKLYNNFEHWKAKGIIWLFSDPHFDDEDCKLINGEWPTPEKQVEIINKFVGKNDTIIFLGDIGNPEWIKKIKGYKVLLLGNHDKGVSNYLKKYILGKYPHLDVVSLGPTMKSPHTTTERALIETVAPFWQLLKKTLEDIPEK